jgi:hypothetical protein
MPLDTSRLAQTVSQTRHTSVPLDLRLLDSLPPRSASLGPILEGQLPTPSPSAVPSLEFASDKSVPTKTLRRDKTKSKVWGIFGGGKKKDKKDKVEASPESKPRHAFEVRPVDGESPNDCSTPLTCSSFRCPSLAHYRDAPICLDWVLTERCTRS